MVRTLSDKTIPQAQRAVRPGWRDPRLWVGVVMVAASVVVGAQVVSGADDTTAIWAVRADMGAGALLSADDLIEVQIRFADPHVAQRYLPVAGESPVDRPLARSLEAGELLPASSLGEGGDGNVQLAVAVAAAQVPPGVRPGSHVDLWVAPRTSSESAEAQLLVRGVQVVEAPAAGSDLSGVAGERQVVIAVPDDTDALAQVIAASGSGELVLVGRS